MAEPDMSMPAPAESAGLVSAEAPPDDPADEGAGDDPEPVSGAAPVAEQAPRNIMAASNAQQVLARVRMRVMVPFRGERTCCGPRPSRSETNDNPTDACRRPIGCHCRGLMTTDAPAGNQTGAPRCLFSTAGVVSVRLGARSTGGVVERRVVLLGRSVGRRTVGVRRGSGNGSVPTCSPM